MKYIYIAGLEHSGTTLLSHLLASQPGVLSLGEVGQFLSRAHMHDYLGRWGEFEDVTRCSCGSDWNDCSVWASLMDLNGCFDQMNIAEGYKLLIQRLSLSAKEQVIVDTSKSLENLDSLSMAWLDSGFDPADLLVLVIAKDPRGFACSIAKKDDRKPSMLNYWRSTNWWKKVYRQWLNKSASTNVIMAFLTYAQLCFETDEVISSIGEKLGLSFENNIDVAHNRSHIALGNKNFIERNRSAIQYDDKWKNDWRVQLAWLGNAPARKVQRGIKSSCI